MQFQSLNKVLLVGLVKSKSETIPTIHGDAYSLFLDIKDIYKDSYGIPIEITQCFKILLVYDLFYDQFNKLTEGSIILIQAELRNSDIVATSVTSLTDQIESAPSDEEDADFEYQSQLDEINEQYEQYLYEEYLQNDKDYDEMMEPYRLFSDYDDKTSKYGFDDYDHNPDDYEPGDTPYE
tara:strand:+ start:1029 stop:1568 length:540 start_codon:yes stop_codon:yes gene_type:complete